MAGAQQLSSSSSVGEDGGREVITSLLASHQLEDKVTMSEGAIEVSQVRPRRAVSSHCGDWTGLAGGDN